MKQSFFGLVLVFAISVVGCDNQGIMEPAQEAVSGTTSHAIANGQEGPLVKTLVINRLLVGADINGKSYMVSGVIRYTMAQNRAPREIDGLSLSSYMIQSEIDGNISQMPHDDPFWTFSDKQADEVSFGLSPATLTLPCLLAGRSDGAILQIDLAVSGSGFALRDLWIEVPGINPGVDTN